MKPVATDNAPAAIGAYSQAITHDGIVYCSGQIGLRPDGSWAGSSVQAQAEAALRNLGAILEAAGSAPNQVIRATIFLASMEDFGIVNEAYAQFFGDHRPARACVEASRLPKDALVEISCIAATTPA
jgi:2-iminobutanoate/2-iminopropanoate deaminase